MNQYSPTWISCSLGFQLEGLAEPGGICISNTAFKHRK